MNSSMDADSEAMIIFNGGQATAFNKSKRHMKTPSQLEALEKAFTATKYPSLAEMDELAVKLGLLESQVRMWFYYRRMKDKKESSRKKPLGVPGRKKKRTIRYASINESESESEESDELREITPDESGEPSNAEALTEHQGRSGDSSDGRIVEISRLKKMKLEYPPPKEAQSLLIKSACVESHFLVQSQKASEEIETSKKSLRNVEAELDDVEKKVQSAKKEVKDLKSRLMGKDDVIAAWRAEVSALKAELDAAKVEKDSAAKLFEEKLNAKNKELEDLHRQLETERACHKEEKDEAYARFGNDVVALVRKFKNAT